MKQTITKNQTILADPLLLTASKRAQKHSLMASDALIRIMEATLKAAPTVQPGDMVQFPDGNRIPFQHPTLLTMEREAFKEWSDDYIAQLTAATVPTVKGQTTHIEDQREALMDAAQHAFHASLFTANSVSDYIRMLDYLKDVKNTYYATANLAETTRMDPVFCDLRTSINLAIDARKAITRMVDIAMGDTGDDLHDLTPYGAAVEQFARHYPEKLQSGKLTIHDQRQILGTMQRVMNEVIEPYASVLPSPQLPEMMGLVWRIAERLPRSDQPSHLPAPWSHRALGKTGQAPTQIVVDNDDQHLANPHVQQAVCKRLATLCDGYNKALGKDGRDMLLLVAEAEAAAGRAQGR